MTVSYLYALDLYAGSDRIFLMQDEKWGFKPGDVIADGEHLFVFLGEKIIFPEQYQSVYRAPHGFTCIEKWFLSKPQLALLHHCVYTYFTTYKAVMRLLLPPMALTQLLSYKKSNKKSQFSPIVFDTASWLFIQSPKPPIAGQQLVIVPDLWTAYNMIDASIRENVTWRHSALSPLQMTKIFRWCKQGQVGTLITTFAGIFHDRRDLRHILFIEPHKRYYQHQQDPRYKVAEVVNFIVTETGAKCTLCE